MYSNPTFTLLLHLPVFNRPHAQNYKTVTFNINTFSFFRIQTKTFININFCAFLPPPPKHVSFYVINYTSVCDCCLPNTAHIPRLLQTGFFIQPPTPYTLTFVLSPQTYSYTHIQQGHHNQMISGGATTHLS